MSYPGFGPARKGKGRPFVKFCCAISCRSFAIARMSYPGFEPTRKGKGKGCMLSFSESFHVGRLQLPVRHAWDLDLRGRGRVYRLYVKFCCLI